MTDRPKPKIIRDGYGARIEPVALRMETSDVLVIDLLSHKVAEEIAEFTASGHLDASELGDALEALQAIAARAGIAWREVEAARVEKHARLGGFEHGLVYDKTLDPDDGRAP